MQDFQDNEKKHLKMTTSRLFWIRFLRNCHGLFLCEPLHFGIYAWSSYFDLFLSCLNITNSLKFKMATRPPFLNCMLPKVIQVIG